MAELFISYSKSNRVQALDLATELRGHGFSVWIDQTGIEGAKMWTSEIVEAIDACSTLLVLLSPDSIASHNVAKEVQLASDKQKHILPVVIEKVTLPNVFEYPLAGLQRVHYDDRDAIVRALKTLKAPRQADKPSVTESQSPASHDGSIRVAVLPFDDLSPHHDNQWFADGVMDELISTLGHIEHVKVRPRSDVLHYREHHKTSREIASELGVRYLIEGGVRKANDKIRISASLIDTAQSEQLWSNKFDGTFDDVFAFQELVSSNIADALKLELTPEEKLKLEDHGTDNAEAYELYLKGRHAQYYFTKESYLKALDFYQQATVLDPGFAKAYVNMAFLCCAFYRDYSREPEWLRRAEEEAQKAEQVGGETSRTLSIRGMIEWLKGHPTLAIDFLKRSIEFDRNNHVPFNLLGTIYTIRGDYLLATEAFQEAANITQSPQDFFNLVVALRNADQPAALSALAPRAIAAFDRYLLREAKDLNARVSRALIMVWAGKQSEAQKEADSLMKMNDLNGHALYNLGVLYDYLGKPELRVSLFRKAIEQGYREIEQTRKQGIITENPEIQQKFFELVNELEERIKLESGMG